MKGCWGSTVVESREIPLQNLSKTTPEPQSKWITGFTINFTQIDYSLTINFTKSVVDLAINFEANLVLMFACDLKEFKHLFSHFSPI